MPHSNLARIFALLFLVCCGCAEKTPPAPSAASAANVQPVPPPELAIEDLPEFEIPGGRLQVPEWAGKRADEPFPVREYVEELLERQSDGERWYLAGLGRLHSELADCAITRKEELDSSVEQLESLLKAMHSDAVSTRNFIPRAARTPSSAITILNLAEPALAAIDRAQRYKPCLFGTDLTITQNKLHMRACLRLAQLMDLQIYVAAQQHQFSDIDHAITRTLRLSRDVRPASADVGDLVGDHMERLLFESLQNDFLHSSLWSAEEYGRVQQLIRDHFGQEQMPFDRSIRESYIITGNALWALEHKTVSPDVLEIGNPDEALMNLVNYPAEWEALNRIYGWLITEYASAPFHETQLVDEFSNQCDDLKANAPRIARNKARVDGKLAAPFVYLLLFPGINQMRERFVIRRLAAGLVDVALQVRRFEILNERSPTSMDELYSGNDEPHRPIDPYSGEALKYRLLESSAAIYSVGKDQVDGGGASQWDETQMSGDIIYSIGITYGQ